VRSGKMHLLPHALPSPSTPPEPRAINLASAGRHRRDICPGWQECHDRPRRSALVIAKPRPKTPSPRRPWEQVTSACRRRNIKMIVVNAEESLPPPCPLRARMGAASTPRLAKAETPFQKLSAFDSSLATTGRWDTAAILAIPTAGTDRNPRSIRARLLDNPRPMPGAKQINTQH